jgi:hypothetical protein
MADTLLINFIRDKIAENRNSLTEIKDSDDKLKTNLKAAQDVHNKILLILKAEIIKDPAQMGYKGKSEEEIVELLIKPLISIQEDVSIQSSRLSAVTNPILQRYFDDPNRIYDALNVVMDGEGKIFVSLPALQDEINEAIKKEIETDPEKIGYKGKTDQEVKELLRSSFTVKKKKIIQRPVRFNDIMRGVKYCPNVPTVTMVAEALKLSDDVSGIELPVTIPRG